MVRAIAIASLLFAASCASRESEEAPGVNAQEERWERLQGAKVFLVEVNFENKGLVSFMTHTRKDCPDIAIEMDKYDEDRVPFTLVTCKVKGRAFVDSDGFQHLATPDWCFMCGTASPPTP